MDGSDSDSDSDGDLGAFGADGPRLSKRKLRDAWRAEEEAEHPLLRKCTSKRDKEEKHAPLGQCTACRQPFFDCMQVFEHPALGVGLCAYCVDAVRAMAEPRTEPTAAEPAAAATAEATEAEPAADADADGDDNDRCAWCGGESCLDGHDELLGCETDGCGAWFCVGCVRANLGDAEAERARTASPWACYKCAPAPLSPLRAQLAALQSRRERRAAREEKARTAHRARAGRAASKPRSASAVAAEINAEMGTDGTPARGGGRAARAAPGADYEEFGADAPPIVLWEATGDEPADASAKSGRRRAEVPDGPPAEAVAVAPFLAAVLKPHQIEAVRFMWRAVLAERRADMTKTSRRREHGCVLAHSMGLGKTLSVIAFLHTALTRASNGAGVPYIRYKNGREPPPPAARAPPTALILVPKSVGTQWAAEFQRWLRGAPLPVYSLTSSTGGVAAHLSTLRRWHDSGGALIMTHNLFLNAVQPPKEKTPRGGGGGADGGVSGGGGAQGGADAGARGMREEEKLLLGADVLVRGVPNLASG